MRKIFIAAVFAVVLLSACGRSTTVAPQTLPGQPQGQPAVTTEQAGVPVLQGNDALNSLNSYRTKISMKTEKDGTIESDFELIQEETRSPVAKRWVYDTSNTGQESKMEIISIDGKQWMNIGGSWMMSQQTPEEAAKSFGSDALNSFDVVDEFNKGNYTLVGNENLNGLNTKHYVLNVTSAELTGLTMGMSDVSNSKVDVWVANGAGLPVFTVKYMMNVEGKKDGVPAKFTMISEVYDINQPFTIELPAEAANGGMPEDIPAYSGTTTETFTSQGMISFKTTDNADAVKVFYEQSMPSNGWAKQTSEMEMFLTWTKGEKTAQLMVTAEDSGGTSVVFMLTGQ